MRIGFATADYSFSIQGPDGGPPYGGAGHYRMKMPSDGLEALGHNVWRGGLIYDNDNDAFGINTFEELRWLQHGDPDFPEGWPYNEAPTWSGQHKGGFDVIVMQRIMVPGVADKMRRARANGQVIINDIDDDFWRLDKRNTARRSTDAAKLGHYRDIVLGSDLVTCSTPFLAQAMREMGQRNVVVLRNMIDLAAWPEPRTRNYEAPPTYGWVGSIPWRSGDIERLQGTLGRFLTAHPEVTFRHGGHMEGGTTFASLAKIDPERVVTAPMCATYERSKLYRPIDVGLVPLNDIPFNEAKSAIKGMEYLAAGAPFIADNLPEYRWARAEGMGLVAKHRADWSKLLERMLNPIFRAEEAERGREALKRHDVPARIGEWESAYLNAATR